MNTAVGDGLVKRNPCQIKGGGAENASERPILSIAEVYALADAIEPRFRALVLLTVFADLRWGEAVALRRKDLDLDARLVRIERTLVEVAGSPLHFRPPKTDAGTRRLPVPEVIVDELRSHLEQYAQDGEEGLIFVGAKGAMLRRGGFRRIWGKALAEVGLKGFRFHNLRHTGSTLAAIAGATLPELKERMGHASDRAAMIYLHATQERHQEIADTLSAMTRAHLKDAVEKPTGTRRARKGRKQS